MNGVLITILSLSVSGSVMALILFAGKPLLKNRVSKAFSYYIWLLVLLRLVLPIAAPINIMGTLFHVQQPNTEAAEQTGISAATEQVEQHSGNPSNTQAISPEMPKNETKTPQVSSNAGHSVSIWDLIKDNALWIWLSGSIISFGWFMTAYIFFSRRMRRSCVAPQRDDMAVFRKMCRDSHIRLACSSNVTTPVLIGIIHPVMVLPQFAYVRNQMENELKNILRHELTHYRRKDILYKWFVVAVTSLHWFNPFMVLVRKEIGKACELSCDEAVISNMSTVEMRQYGNTLLTFSAAKKYPAGIPATTLSEGKAELKERLVSIMKYRKKSAWLISSIFAVMVTFTGCALGWGMPKEAASNRSGTSSQPVQSTLSAPSQTLGRSKNSSPVSNGAQTHAGSQPENQNASAGSTPAQLSVITQANKALNTKVPVMLPARISTAQGRYLAATTAAQTSNYKVNFYETNNAAAVNSKEASQGTPIASVEGTLYKDEANAKQTILDNNYEVLSLSSYNEEMIINLGHNIKALRECGMGHNFITWNEGRWCLHVESPSDPAYKYTKYPNSGDLAENVVTYLSTNMLPVPHEVGVISIEDWAKNHEATIEWQENKTVYQISSSDPMTALKVAVAMKTIS
jgi:beta-lactamase regulating signal transducer with metallopeptidase domain